MKSNDVRGWNRGLDPFEVQEQVLSIIESPEFQRWKLDRQNSEPDQMAEINLCDPFQE